MTAMRALGAGRQQLFDRRGVPGLDAFALNQVDDLFVELGRKNRLLTSLAHEDRNWHAPDALAADAPVGPGRNHVRDALLTPRGIPRHLGNLINRLLTEGLLLARFGLDLRVKIDEPLLGRAEDHRLVAAPAMRIGVLEVLLGQKSATRLEQLNHQRIGGKYLLALKGGQFGFLPCLLLHMHRATVIHAAGQIDPVALAGVEVICAMRGSRVHAARARVGRYIGRQHATHSALKKGMLEDGLLKNRSLEACNFGRRAQLAVLNH